jgi:hypothetical protein
MGVGFSHGFTVRRGISNVRPGQAVVMLVSQGTEVAESVPEGTGFKGFVLAELNLDWFYSKLEARLRVLSLFLAVLTQPAPFNYTID